MDSWVSGASNDTMPLPMNDRPKPTMEPADRQLVRWMLWSAPVSLLCAAVALSKNTDMIPWALGAVVIGGYVPQIGLIHIYARLAPMTFRDARVVLACCAVGYVVGWTLTTGRFEQGMALIDEDAFLPFLLVVVSRLVAVFTLGRVAWTATGTTRFGLRRQVKRWFAIAIVTMFVDINVVGLLSGSDAPLTVRLDNGDQWEGWSKVPHTSP